MKFFGVAGSPVLHSKSPLIFANFFKNSSTEAAYGRVAADSAGEVIFIFNSFGFSGMNITSPFKNAIVPYLAALDESASVTGSVNTIVRQDNGINGFNTDHTGAVKAFERRGVNLTGKKCVVLGAGGAAASAAYGLLKKGAKVTLVNRTYKKAQKAAAILGCRAVKLDSLKDFIMEIDILVSAIPSGNELIRRDWLREDIIVLDANYKNPALFKIAESAGCGAIRGEEWLYYQALGAYSLFTGQAAREADVYSSPPDFVGRGRKRQNISLIGFMGSGKTSVGRKVAEKMGKKFIDSDEEIEKNERMDVREIFEKKGETYFRAKERMMVEKLKEMKGTVFSCGGGAVMDSRNQQILKERSIVIFLFSTLETCLKRAEGNKRPLLNKAHSGKIVEELYSTRNEFYFCSADLLVNSENIKEEVANKIYNEIRQAFGN